MRTLLPTSPGEPVTDATATDRNREEERNERAGTAHHIIGLAQGGDPLDPDNLTPAHRGCNTSASNRLRGTARRRRAVRDIA
jgi:HNH endonuclease